MQLREEDLHQKSSLTDIAVIGMSGRFPGADTLDIFWKNLIQGIETISQFTQAELREAGVPNELLENINYIRAKGILNNIELFDAPFFGYNSHDAKMTDPQQKLFLECVWDALEFAGCIPEKYSGSIGVYASMADSSYLQNNVLKNKDPSGKIDGFQARMATSLTTLSTRVSYHFNLTGPSINLTTACSSALVVIATACRALIDYECDLAIAGAVTITLPKKNGYLYQEDGIESPDGQCRAFDAAAKGTVFGDGLGVIILKRFQEAVQDHDSIYAVIKGWNINNDGSDKVGFTAPSVNGQAQCVASALTFADVHPDSISYIEAHGTGTALGDPIELHALTKAFHLQTDKKQFCAIGSVKTNIGHTDIAAGMAGFIKTSLALKNKIIPASLHYRQANPNIDFPNTPFYVNTETKPWDFGHLPRRAGVNASGIGGTNAFLLLEESMVQHENTASRPYQLLLLSAKTKTALETANQNLSRYLDKIQDDGVLADIAFTLQVGRADFNHRRMMVCQDLQDAQFLLKNLPDNRVLTGNHKNNSIPKIVFMFPGQGSQYTGMAKHLYHAEPFFAEIIDDCYNQLEPQMQHALYDVVFNGAENCEDINNTEIAQPALFTIEYALAKLLINFGVKPDALIGHSVGEYVAACLSGVFSLKDALQLICARARMMSNSNRGGMLAVPLSADELSIFLKHKQISLAAVNSTNSCVIAGDLNTLHQLVSELEQHAIITRSLKTSHAFHSYMMDPILDEFRSLFSRVTFQTPTIPFISNVTGDWANNRAVMEPDYWVTHLRQTVQFLQGIQTLKKDEYTVFLEVGPGKTLAHFANECIQRNSEVITCNTLPSFKDDTSDQEVFLSAIGQLWLHGVCIDWTQFYKYEKRQRIPLPTYPFERKLYWISPDLLEGEPSTDKKLSYQKWFYEPSWRRTALQHEILLDSTIFHKTYCWIILADSQGVGDTLMDILSGYRQCVIKVTPGLTFTRRNRHEYIINCSQKEDHQLLVKAITETTNLPICLLNLFPLTPEHELDRFSLKEVQETVYSSFYSILFFTQALLEQEYAHDMHALIIGNEQCSVLGTENIYPAKATATGPCRVIPQEHPVFKIKIVDLLLSDLFDLEHRLALCRHLLLEALSEHTVDQECIIAYRGHFRWVQTFQPLSFSEQSDLTWTTGGVYLLTGGLGGISLTLAKSIACCVKNAQLVLLSRAEFPKQATWQAWILKHGPAHPVSKKITQLQALQDLGAEISVLQGDITNFEQTQDNIETIRKTYGRLNGVIHAAGIPGGGLVQLKTVEMARKVFAPKVEGTHILTHILRDEPLDFFVFCSSLSAIIGELSQVDYCGANACLDAFVHAKVLRKTRLLTSINWNTWREVGMAVEIERPTDVTHFDRGNDILPQEGATVFLDVLRHRYRQAIISIFEVNAFNRRIYQNRTSDVVHIAPAERDNLFRENDGYTPPTNDLEYQLVELWQNILGADQVGIEDDFFALGGHSLMALRLLAKISQTLNVKISLQTFQENKTIKTLAMKLNAAATKAQSLPARVIPIRSEGSQSPLFCFHPVGGTVFSYTSLATHLVFDCPIYGIQDPSFDHGKLIYSTLEQMATDYIQAIQKIQEQGPYVLCGFSFGSMLAVEVAHQLRQQNERVKSLILLDGWASFSSVQRRENLFKKTILQRTASMSDIKLFSDLSWARMQLLLNYKVPTIEDDIILFKAVTLLPEYEEINQEYNYWDKHTKRNIVIYRIPGDHETILEEPNVAVLTKQLNSVLVSRS